MAQGREASFYGVQVRWNGLIGTVAGGDAGYFLVQTVSPYLIHCRRL